MKKVVFVKKKVEEPEELDEIDPDIDEDEE